MTISHFIEDSEQEPLRAIKPLPVSDIYVNPILASALSLASSGDVWVDEEIVEEVFSLAMEEFGEAVALKETISFISVWQDYQSQAQTRYNDLLPDGHPRNPYNNSFDETILYMTTQIPRSFDQTTFASVVKCMENEPGSVQRKYYSTVIASVAPQVDHLIATIDQMYHTEL
jgi:hypothetical protein